MSIARVAPSDDMDKTAVISGNDMKNALLYMTIGGAIQPLVGGVEAGTKKISDSITKNKTWKEIIGRYPDMDDEATKERFEAMFDMSPSVMKHVTFAVPSLRSASEYGTGGIPVDLAGKLVSIDSQRTRGNPNLAQGILSGATIGLGAAHKDQQMRQSAEQFAEKQDLGERTLAQKIKEFNPKQEDPNGEPNAV